MAEAPTIDISRNEFDNLGIKDITIEPVDLYEKLKSIPKQDRQNHTFLFSCTGGNERSPRFGQIALKMGFNVANLTTPETYHKKYGVPIDELAGEADNAIFPQGQIKFPNMDKPVDHIVVFTDDIYKGGEIATPDKFKNRMIKTIGIGLSKSAEREGDKPNNITLMRVPSTERQVGQIERLLMADEME